ncbi:MAG TPA: hypothetical protein VGP26_02590 [Actinophytocola sp.]|jgi:hypothetical protein|nr:hypothetical protein [Actinophytocola sp.]
MADNLAASAELVKLARALGTTQDEIAFTTPLGAAGIRLLRERVVGALYDEHRAAFRRVAAITRTLPMPVNVRITLRAFPPLLAARVAGEMTPERAAELANRLPVEYLAESCVHLDPRRAAPLISRLDPDRVLAVVVELVDRDDFVTLGRLLDAASEKLLAHLAAAISDEALLRIGCYAESGAQLARAIGVLTPERLRGIVRTAVTGPPDLRAAGLATIGRLDDDLLRGRLAEYAASASDDVLTAMLHTALDEGAVAEMLSAVAAMGEDAQRRVVSLPALGDEAVRTRLVDAAADLGLLPILAPLDALRSS